MNKVIEKIQNENSAETMDKHLKTAVMMLSGDSFNFNIKEDHF
jgi:hypothetical protein